MREDGTITACQALLQPKYEAKLVKQVNKKGIQNNGLMLILPVKTALTLNVAKKFLYV